MKKPMQKGLLLLSFIVMASTMNIGAAATGTPTEKKTGYEVDGRTSASVIAAKRSHTVSKNDEMGWPFFSGVFVIGLIVFISQAIPKK